LDPVPEIRAAQARSLALGLAPAPTAAEIDAIGAGVGAPLPRELAELLPCGLPIAGDGFGDFWALDVTPAATDVAPVFFHCHDPPVLIYQSPDLGHFVHECLLEHSPDSLVAAVHDDAALRVWRERPGAVGHAAALVGDDADLSAFASGLDAGFEFVDLRAPAVGDGFAWGSHGPRTELRS
jgi:hypothetical protein